MFSEEVVMMKRRRVAQCYMKWKRGEKGLQEEGGEDEYIIQVERKREREEMMKRRGKNKKTS